MVDLGATVGDPRTEDKLSREDMVKEMFLQFSKNLMSQELALSLAAIVEPEKMLTFIDEMNAMSGRITEIAQRSVEKEGEK